MTRDIREGAAGAKRSEGIAQARGRVCLAPASQNPERADEKMGFVVEAAFNMGILIVRNA